MDCLRIERVGAAGDICPCFPVLHRSMADLESGWWFCAVAWRRERTVLPVPRWQDDGGRNTDLCRKRRGRPAPRVICRVFVWSLFLLRHHLRRPALPAGGATRGSGRHRTAYGRPELAGWAEVSRRDRLE